MKEIGLAPTGDCFLPKDNSPEAVEEARKKSVGPKVDFVMTNAWWADPIFLGRAPEWAGELLGDKMYTLTEEEWKSVSQPLDFYGYNCYQGTLDYPVPADGYDTYGYQGCPRRNFGWNLTPQSLYYSSKFWYERYGLPVLITENGYAGLDHVMLDGKVHDPQRQDWMHRYLLELKRAVDEGIPVLGYRDGGNYTYVKTFSVPEGDTGKYIVKFEGVYAHALVYANQQLAGTEANGYAGFYVDLTSWLRPGEENELRVQVKNTGMTIAFWVKAANSDPGISPLYSFNIVDHNAEGYIATTDSLEIAINTDGNSGEAEYPRVWADPADVGPEAKPVLTAGKWQHVAVTLSSTGMTIYLDGQKYSEPALGPSSANFKLFIDQIQYCYGLQLGNWNCGWWDDIGSFAGSFDNVRVYNKALSADEVGSVMNTGAIK